MRRFAIAALAAFITTTVAPAQTFTPKALTTPIAIQDGFGPGGRDLGYDGLAYCGPTAFNMALGYLGVNGYSRLGSLVSTPAELLNRERILSGLAGTSAVGGTSIDGLQAGIDTLLQAKGISLSDRSWNIANRPWVEDLPGVNVAPTVNVLLLGWYHRNMNGTYSRQGGHFITLLDQNPNAQGTGTITINNPDPSSLMPASDTPPFAQQTLQLSHWPHTSVDLPGPPYMSSGRPGFLQFDPNQFPGWLGNAAVLETSIALTINPAVRDAGYPQHTWTINAASRKLNTNGGNLDVTAPIDGSGGFEKLGPGSLNLLDTVALTGTITVTGGTLSSNQATGSPFGTGPITLNGGTLALTPGGSGAAVSLTSATGSTGTFSYGGGAVLSLDRGGNNLLTYTVGNGAGSPLVRDAAGTLAIAAATGTANLGTLERFVVNGTPPPVVNGMVAPSIVGQDNDANRSGDFLNYGVNGFVRANYTQSTSTPITSATSSTVFEVNNAQTVPAGQTATVQALKVGAFTVGGGVGSTLSVAGVGGEAGVILNGGTVGVPTLAVGSADLLAYASNAGGTINSALTGSGRLVKYGPGTLNLGGVNSLTGQTVVQSGTLNLTTSGAGGSSAISINAGAQLAVAPGVEVAGPVTVFNSGLLNAGHGSRFQGGFNVTGPNGRAVMTGDSTIAAASGNNTVSGVLEAGPLRGVTTFEGMITFAGSAQYIVRLHQNGPGPTDLVSSSIHFTDPALTNFGSNMGGVNITLDLGVLPTPDTLDPFWQSDHSWVIADAASEWNNMWYGFSFVGYLQGNFTVINDSAYSTLSLVYTYAPVPEPSAFILAGVAAVGAWRLRRGNNHGLRLNRKHVRGRNEFGSGRALIAFEPPGIVDPGFDGDPAGYAMQPARQRRSAADGSGLAGERQERGLECVLGQLMVAEYAAADSQHHRTMPPDEQLECVAVAVVRKPREEAIVVVRCGRIRIDLPSNHAHYSSQRAFRQMLLPQVCACSPAFYARDFEQVDRLANNPFSREAQPSATGCASRLNGVFVTQRPYSR